MPGARRQLPRQRRLRHRRQRLARGPVEISAEGAAGTDLHPWPVALRAPLADVTAAPGGAPGALGSGALAVGADGAVLRYEPGRGWQREFLLSSSGSVNKATLRGVAWPEPGRAYAVGDLGAMWHVERGRRPLGAGPRRADRLRGQPDGRRLRPRRPGARLRGGQGRACCSPTARAGTRRRCRRASRRAGLTSIAFAGSQAIVAAGGDLLVNDGGGWQVDASAHALLDSVRAGNPQLFAVAGLPDGGAVAAGRDIVIERDGPGAPWRFSDQPLPGLDGDRRRRLPRRRPGARGRLGRAAARLPAGRRPARPRPERAAADRAAVRAARRRLPAARDRRRLGRRAAHRLRRLEQRQAG